MTDYDVTINDTAVGSDVTATLGAFLRSISDNAKGWDCDPTLLGYYKCDEGTGSTLNDSTGFRKHLTLAASYSWNTSVASGFTFTNTNSIRATSSGNATASDANYPYFGLDDFTISVWINCSISQTQTTPVIIDKLASPTAGWQLNTSSITGLMRFRAFFGGTTVTLTSSQIVVDGQWKHYAIVKDSTNITMYINGVQEVQASHTTASSSNTIGTDSSQALKLFVNSLSGTAQFIGSIDELRFYSRALTLLEIQDLSNKNIGVQSSLSTATNFGRSFSDNLAGLDAVTKGYLYSALAQENLVATDDCTTLMFFGRMVSDLTAIADDWVRGKMVHARAVTDNLAVPDGYLADHFFNIFVSDLMAVADNKILNAISNRTISDTSGITDGYSALTAYARAISDSIAISDNISRTGVSNRSLSDNVLVQEAFYNVSSMLRTLSDTANISDSTLTIANSFRSISDLAVTTDNIGAARVILVLLQEVLAATDNAKQNTIFGRLLSEVAALSESVLSATTSNRQVNDTAAIGQGTVQTTTQSNRTVQDSTVTTDATFFTQAHARAVQDLLGLFDANQFRSVFNRQVQDTTTLADNLKRIASCSRQISDLCGSADTTTEILFTLTRLLYDAEDYGLFGLMWKPNDADVFAPQVLEKIAEDVRFIGVDFTVIMQGEAKGTFNFFNDDGSGPNIATVDSFTVDPVFGAEDDLTALGPLVFGVLVFWQFQGGRKDTEYTITCKVTDDAGGKHYTKLKLIVR